MSNAILFYTLYVSSLFSATHQMAYTSDLLVRKNYMHRHLYLKHTNTSLKRRRRRKRKRRRKKRIATDGGTHTRAGNSTQNSSPFHLNFDYTLLLHCDFVLLLKIFSLILSPIRESNACCQLMAPFHKHL